MHFHIKHLHSLFSRSLNHSVTNSNPGLDPYRYDCVAYSTEATTSTSQLTKLREQIAKTEEGQLLLQEKPTINSNTVDLECLQEGF